MCGRGGRVGVLLVSRGDSVVGELAGEEDAEAAGEDGGVAMDAVDRREAAMVRRRCDSVLRVAVMMQPGQPTVQDH
jgi:hypothetical protein